MDEFKRHSGLIVNEMKLSECLSVGAAGKVEGFVDLRSFTPDSQKHIPLDHGHFVSTVDRLLASNYWEFLLPEEM